MCLLIIAHQTSDQLPLVIAANRDEFHNRPTARSTFWQEHPTLLAGRDLQQGGTWMGITRDGRFAALTNFRDPARTTTAPRSRGELPLNFLTGVTGPEQYMNALSATAHDYAGFNLLLGDGHGLWYCSNSNGQRDVAPRQLEPGVYGLSNALLDTPWPKVTRGRAAMLEALESAAPDHDRLADVVNDRAIANPVELREQGLDHEMDQLLSAQFIITQRYGTRCTTTMWTDDQGVAHWREVSFDSRGEEQARQTVEFQIQ
tara:strand:+ start:46705 stop:47481 length:777 start_codon:yes stop_codon:yes gene_type:complete